ncbi:amino acid adenylation domain-containing protein [Streptomyces sp. V3I8]|uniref:non-ribosomal peptide synthetase n=1 Tax=Streptomyces sp. V3I8 TaxID=3042279 RepID=UPI002780801B|nr:amino acid adenylation domain-containing protein [Streptomyces sp. V3I8]MDQ1041117.1 amino acid adenylation domain-containing protein [Streptomyces sp. V3I8]
MSVHHTPHVHVPASFAQQRLWFLAQLPGGNEAYNESIAFTIRGPLDAAVLRRALDTLVVRHQTLRTRLVAVDGEVHQHIDPPETGFALAADDLTGLPDAVAHLDELRLREASAPFDLARGPLTRGRLVTVAADHHVLLLTMHHTVFDGRSMNVMMRELSAVYPALLHGRPSPLPPLPIQYADHARAQQERVLSGGLAGQAAFWQERLAGAPPLSGPPTDRPRPAQQDLRGARVEFALDAGLTSALKALARQHGGTLFVAVLTGWSLLMSRLSGHGDVVVGTPTANRRHKDVSDLIGFFVNTLPLRADFSRTDTAGDALRRVRGVLRDALDHQDLPFERIVELVNPVRSAAHTPLFQTMCAWVPERGGLLELPGLDIAPLDIPHAPAKFDLALSLTESQGRVVGHLDYASALFDKETVRRYVTQLRHLLTDMVARPQARVGTLKLMDEHERHLLLTDLAQGEPLTGAPSPCAGGLVERFDEQVATRPARTALVCGDERLDYATLAARAGRLARALAGRGVGPGSVVGLHTGRSVELVVGVLGVLKAGAAYLPLDPAQPPARLAAMVEDAAPALVLSDLPGDGRPAAWHDLVTVETSADNDVPPPLPSSAAPDTGRLAYVLYTSGSTGRPKGVAVTQGSVLNLFDNWLDRMGATPGEATSAWSSIGFDASVHEVLLPLTTGAELHLVPEDLRGDPGELLRWMREHRIVQAFLPPSYVRWIDEEPAKRLDGLALRHLLTGVESLPEAALHRMREHLTDLRVCFGYGPTEATLYSTAYYDPRPLDRQSPIGRPLAGTRMYLLDEEREPVPVGVAGEVYLGGAGLAAGYLHRPDLTAERFLPDPFLPGERVYRTGDLARRLPDGNAVYVGRVDDQVKLRGFRIEPAEIEAALLAQPGVREAAVVVDRDTGGEPRLVAAVGRGDAPAGAPHAWRAALAERLPDYMVPAVVVELAVLPLSRNGKLDRAALLRAAAAAGTGQVNTENPRDHIELTLHGIWRGILLNPDFGIGDSFFDIGGTSLSAIKLAHRIREAFGTTLPVRDIILNPTIEGLGGLVRRGRSGAPPSNLIEFRRGGTGGNVVCVHPAGGTAFCYLPLARTLPADVGLYGIQSPGVNPGEDPLPDVEAMAEEYLRLVEPFGDGPLVLTGLSYGGLVAHEMGRRLARAGRTDVGVVLLDTQATEDAEVRAAVAPVDRAEFRDKLVKFNGMYPGIDDEQIEQYFRIYNHNRMTARDHLPAPSPARVVLVQAVGGTTTDPASLPEVRDFWRRRAEGGFRVELLDCDHWEVLESGASPRVSAVLAAELAGLAGPAGLSGRAESATSAAPAAITTAAASAVTEEA